MNHRLSTLPALILLAGGLTACGAGQDTSADSSSYYGGGGGDNSQLMKDRKPAPSIKGTTIQGEPLDLASFHGKVVVVNFFQSYCGPCRGEAPTLKKISDETKASGVQFVGVDVKDGKDNAQAFERSFKITYPSLYDRAGQVALTFRNIPPNAVPSTLVIDRQGNIAARNIGSVSYSGLRDVVTRLAAEKTGA
jgi:thiol-disulfide isomerase/thioredoxin